MKLRVRKCLRRNTYVVSLRPEEWSRSDLELFHDFGEPEIDIGGVCGVPSSFRKVLSGFPVIMEFEDDSNDGGEDRANAWKDEIVRRIGTAMKALRQLKDDFSGEELHTI